MGSPALCFNGCCPGGHANATKEHSRSFLPAMNSKRQEKKQVHGSRSRVIVLGATDSPSQKLIFAMCSPAVICAENISLYSLLHSVPAPPSSNRTNYTLPHQYHLPVDKELGLSHTLAFLAKIKEGPQHIPAVCVIERQESSNLDVLLAVNRRSSQHGNDLIYKIKRGFENIFAILACVSNGKWPIQHSEVYIAK